MIDVRTPGEFEPAHIAGAYNVPLDLLREHREEIIVHRPIVDTEQMDVGTQAGRTARAWQR